MYSQFSRAYMPVNSTAFKNELCILHSNTFEKCIRIYYFHQLVKKIEIKIPNEWMNEWMNEYQ